MPPWWQETPRREGRTVLSGFPQQGFPGALRVRGDAAGASRHGQVLSWDLGRGAAREDPAGWRAGRGLVRKPALVVTRVVFLQQQPGPGRASWPPRVVPGKLFCLRKNSPVLICKIFMVSSGAEAPGL